MAATNRPHHRRRRHCGPIQAAARRAKYLRQFARTEANLKRKGKTNKKRPGAIG